MSEEYKYNDTYPVVFFSLMEIQASRAYNMLLRLGKVKEEEST